MKRGFLLLMLLLTSVGVVLAQQRVVKGVVISATDKQPIIGASVIVVGHTTVGAATNIEGQFSFKVPNDAKSLKVSYIGYKEQIVPIKSGLIKIVLQATSTQLDQVVVIGYGTATKITNTTASVATVNTKTIQNQPSANMFDAVQGKVAGLQVLTSSGEPGAISSVQLHGIGSLGAGSAPLYVLDGVPVSQGTILSMNPNDFASVSILKDASATSIYGARAANGVIYITSKKGKAESRASIRVSAQYGVSNLANSDYFESLMNTKELAAFLKDYAAHGGAVSPQVNSKVNTRWYKYMFRENAPTYSSDISISGGAGKVGYYISGSFFNQKGIRARSSYNKYTFRANLNSDLNKYVRVSLKNSMTFDNTISSFGRSNGLGGGLGTVIRPDWTPYGKDGKELDGHIINQSGKDSPYWTQLHIEDNSIVPSKSLSLNTVGNIVITPIENLTISSRVGLNLQDNTGLTIFKPTLSYNNNGSISRDFGRDVNWVNSNTLEYRFNIADVNHFNVLAGHEYNQDTYDSFSASGQGLVDNRLLVMSATTKNKDVGSGFSQYAFLSFFGRLSYNYDNKYYLDLTARRDGSSRFGADHRYGNFWSVGAMWKLKRESFAKDLTWLNEANIKFSTGTSGNAAIGNYQSLALVGTYGQYQGTKAFGVSSPGDPDLTWETQLNTTIGFNVRLFDILGIDFSYYNRQTTNMLMSVPFPYTSGFDYLTKNVGKYVNNGIDLRIDADLWNDNHGGIVSVYGTLNYNVDRIDALFDGRDSYIQPNTGVSWKVGQPVMFYYPLFKGVNPKTGMAEWYLPGKDRSVVTKDNSKVTTEFSDGALEQNTGIRRYAPFNGGFGLSAQYKGFYLNADFAFVLGKHLISNDLFFSENPVLFYSALNSRKDVANFWKQEGDQTIFPSPKSGQNMIDFDSRLLQDASFTRLKTLTFGYNVPKGFLHGQDFIKGAKLYVTGRNLLTFTKYMGLDPEIASNLTLGAYPNTKQVSIGLECNF